jgi:hypothetical protein
MELKFDKFLWVIHLTSPASVLDHAKRMGACGIVVRTDRSNKLNQPETLRYFQQGLADNGMPGKVYGWRWPSTTNNDASGKWGPYAYDEADYVINALMPAGIDGYIVDPECENSGDGNCWNGQVTLADNFCKTIRKAADALQNTGRSFLFGVTSGCQYPRTKRDIPLATFMQYCDRSYPQSYWYGDGGILQNGKSPVAAYELGVECWSKINADKPVVPMAGTLEYIRDPNDLKEFAQTSLFFKNKELHFWVNDNLSNLSALDAIKGLEKSIVYPTS